MTKLLVATGLSGGSSYLESVEVVNLDDVNPNLICDNLPDLPFGLYGAIGQLYIKTNPMICGGHVISDCHTFCNGTWISSPNLYKKKAHLASAIFSNPRKEENDIIIITGGFNWDVLSEVDSFNGKFWDQTMFAALPETIFGHCMVKINNSMLLSIGGLIKNTPSAASSNTYFFDVLNNQWVAGPLLSAARYFHSCGVMDWINPDTKSTEKVVVVVGGKDNTSTALSSVELLFVNDYETSKQGWTVGPNLPKTIYAATMTEFQDGVILVGGTGPDFDGHHLFQLSSPTGPWTEMIQTLKEGRQHAVSFLIPDAIVNCH